MKSNVKTCLENESGSGFEPAANVLRNDVAEKEFRDGLDSLLRRTPLCESGNESDVREDVLLDTLEGHSDDGESTDVCSMLCEIEAALLGKENFEVTALGDKRKKEDTAVSKAGEGLNEEKETVKVKRKRRKRAKTEEERKQRAMERKVKNRESANRSRMKTLNELNSLRKENQQQASLILQLRKELSYLRDQNTRLEKLANESVMSECLEGVSIVDLDLDFPDSLPCGLSDSYNESVAFGPIIIISTPLESLVTWPLRLYESTVQSICTLSHPSVFGRTKRYQLPTTDCNKLNFLPTIQTKVQPLNPAMASLACLTCARILLNSCMESSNT